MTTGSSPGPRILQLGSVGFDSSNVIPKTGLDRSRARPRVFARPHLRPMCAGGLPRRFVGDLNADALNSGEAVGNQCLMNTIGFAAGYYIRASELPVAAQPPDRDSEPRSLYRL
jgi:hypothetical protein